MMNDIRDFLQIRVTALALIAALSAAAAEPGVKAQFVGGTMPGIASGTSSRLDMTGSGGLRFVCGKTEILVPYEKVTTLEYGQNVNRRYAAAILISPVLL